jgi:hypothetical protein
MLVLTSTNTTFLIFQLVKFVSNLTHSKKIAGIAFNLTERVLSMYCKKKFNWGKLFSVFVQSYKLVKWAMKFIIYSYKTAIYLLRLFAPTYVCTVGGLIMARFAEIHVWENWRCSLHRLDRVEWFFLSTSWDTYVGTKVEIKYLSLKGRLPEMPKVGPNWKVDFSLKNFVVQKIGKMWTCYR